MWTLLSSGPRRAKGAVELVEGGAGAGAGAELRKEALGMLMASDAGNERKCLKRGLLVLIHLVDSCPVIPFSCLGATV